MAVATRPLLKQLQDMRTAAADQAAAFEVPCDACTPVRMHMIYLFVFRTLASLFPISSSFVVPVTNSPQPPQALEASLSERVASSQAAQVPLLGHLFALFYS